MSSYLKYKGVYYDIGTKVKVKTPQGAIKKATFVGWHPQVGFQGDGVYGFYRSCNADKDVVEIIEPIYPKDVVYVKDNDRELPSYGAIDLGWAWYIIIMIGGVFFHDRWLIWIGATAVFFLWRKGFLNGGKR